MNRPMRFTLRQLLLFVAWLAIVFAVFRVVGMHYASLLGILTAMAFCFVERLWSRWRALPTSETIVFLIAIAATLGVSSFGFSQMIADYRVFTTESQQLQSRIHEDPRFRNVVPTYSGSIGNRTLTLSGTVESNADEQALKQTSSDEFWHFKTDVRWRIEVDPDKSSFDK